MVLKLLKEETEILILNDEEMISFEKEENTKMDGRKNSF